ncbi:MAG: PQQ-dependent sugar dehydrogenase [Balneolaceae bacterium]|nr:PQQ-dependent sugar dehydrogenase [Balneolaceae bacterium]
MLPVMKVCEPEAQQPTETPESQLTVTAERVLSGIDIGWGMDWLPNGDLLLTEKAGRLLLIKDWEIAAEIGGLPNDITVNGQGGFLDVKVHPDYQNNGWIYFTFASTLGEGNGSNTALIRAQLENNELINIERLYKASPNSTRGQHYGSRIEFDNDGYVYFSVGDRGNRDVNPQDISRDMGKIYRLHEDGSIPSNNPFVGENNAKEATYSYGHRNPQGMARHPETGVIWTHEHGPRGGDEVNIHEAGKNYGWPIISFGINYSGTEFAEDTARAGMEQPIHYWDPSIAPSGMSFITSDKYPGWEGDLLVGSLKFAYIAHLHIEDNKVVDETKLVEGTGRIRAIEEGPDGYIYFTAEGDGIYRLVPKE